MTVPRAYPGAALLAALAVLAPGCTKHDKPSAATSKSATSKSTASASVAHAAQHVLPADKEWHPPDPSGPVLAILAGQGVGPIRIGATVATIERQMQKKCDVVTAKLCRYVDRAVEFDLQNGEVKTIRVERPGRPAGKDAKGNPLYYGIFHGAIPPDIKAGMLPWAVQRVLGPPLSSTKRDGSGPNHTVEVAQYNGMTLEYDKLPNGKLALGEIRIHK